MSTLVVLPRFPNERTGTGQRSRLLIKGACIAGKTHVVLIDGNERDWPHDELPGVETITGLQSQKINPTGFLSRRLGGALRLIMPQFAYSTDKILRSKLLDLMRRHEVQSVIFRYCPLYSASGITVDDGVRVYVDVDDRDDQKYKTRLNRLLGLAVSSSFIGQVPLGRLARILQQKLSRATHVWFAAKEDEWSLGNAQVSLLPNVAYQTTTRTDILPSSVPPNVLFVGIFNHLPNREGVEWFLEKCWPKVVDQVPAANLRIVGRGEWPRLAAKYPNINNVEFVGEVAELLPEYAAARLAICPVLEGGGSKIKVIEAASYGRPVLATPHSLRGFEGLDHSALKEAESAEDFASSCIKFLMQPEYADEMGSRSFAWQHQHYSSASFIQKVANDLKE